MAPLNLTRIRIFIAAVSLLIVTVLSLSIMISLGVSGQEAFQALSGEKIETIYLNSNAFRSSTKTANAAWFVIDQQSLSSILGHNYKTHTSDVFRPKIPREYTDAITQEAQNIIAGCGIFFLTSLIICLLVINKIVGQEYSYELFRQARASFGDPEAPYRDRISSLEHSLLAAVRQLESHKEELDIYKQKRGPIKTVVKYMAREDQQTLKRLGISPEEYFRKKAEEQYDKKSETAQKQSF